MNRRVCSLGLMGVLLTSVPANLASAADEEPNTEVADETARVTAEAALVNARAAQINAEASLNKAKVDALALPSFSGATTLNAGAGGMEATILATAAVEAAADKIVEQTQKASKYIVLAGDEAIDFGIIGRQRVQMEAIRLLFLRANVPEKSVSALMNPALAIAAVSAAAGLLRAETTVTPIELNAISSRMLATAVAGNLRTNALLPSAPVFPPEEEAGSDIPWKQKTILQRLNTLIDMREAAAKMRKSLGEKPKPKAKALADLLDAATARFDTFLTKATSPDEKGSVPISEAARLEIMMKWSDRILRVYVEKAGGSLVNTKNLATTLGLDPVKVSGGLVASYTITNPIAGNVENAGVFYCRTTLTSLRKVQEANWSAKKAAGSRASSSPSKTAREAICEAPSA